MLEKKGSMNRTLPLLGIVGLCLVAVGAGSGKDDVDSNEKVDLQQIRATLTVSPEERVDSIELLIRGLNDSSIDTRKYAVIALSEMRTKESIQALLVRAKTESSIAVLSTIMGGLWRHCQHSALGFEVRQALLEGVKADATRVRMGAMWSISSCPFPEAIPALETALTLNIADREREVAADALQSCLLDQHCRAVAMTMMDGDTASKLLSLRELDCEFHQSFQLAVSDLIRSPHREVQWEALRVLAKLRLLSNTYGYVVGNVEALLDEAEDPILREEVRKILQLKKSEG